MIFKKFENFVHPPIGGWFLDCHGPAALALTVHLSSLGRRPHLSSRGHRPWRSMDCRSKPGVFQHCNFCTPPLVSKGRPKGGGKLPLPFEQLTQFTAATAHDLEVADRIHRIRQRPAAGQGALVDCRATTSLAMTVHLSSQGRRPHLSSRGRRPWRSMDCRATAWLAMTQGAWLAMTERGVARNNGWGRGLQ